MLVGQNALSEDLNQHWEQDNQAWWDWYVTLADNKDNATSIIDIPPIQHLDMPSDSELGVELSTPYKLTKDHKLAFRRDGFIRLPNVLSPAAVFRLRKELIHLLNKTFPENNRANRFLSLEMMWIESPIIRQYVLSPRIAKISADLLSVKSVRLYHDNALSKEPGCGRTPWHYDDHHFPLETNDVVTAWMPAQPVPLSMGPLSFAKPLNVFNLVKNITFNKNDTSYDKKVTEIFKANKVSIDSKPFGIGEASFHHNLSFHTAGNNRTSQSRIVLANTYFADGARVVKEPTMISGDWQKFIPGADPGGVVASEFNPVCWPSIKKRRV
ncbi:phytanoyl-CoA dioxygenase family protein [Methylophilaceae bacterium]|nr:phytanoyl-CoA dioxygenase family protein [Methylophilaceae bacterium]